MSIQVLDANGNPVTINTINDLIALIGELSATPTANTMMARLKGIQDNTDGLEGFVDGLEALMTGTTNAIVTLQGLVDALEASSGKDLGFGLTSSWGLSGAPFSSANASVADAAVTDAPSAGQKIVIDDIIVSVDTDMAVTFKEETSGNVLFGPWYLSAKSGPIQITPRGKRKLAAADKKVMVRSSVAGNITCTLSYHSEV